MKKLVTILLFFISVSSFSQTCIDTTIDGYNAVIWRPAKYYINGNADSSIHCIVFSYGSGETGASYATMRSIGGPIPYLLADGPDSVTISGVVIHFIAIGLRIPTAFPTSGQPLAKLDAIRAAFKIKKVNLHPGGFSAGGYAYKIMATEDNFDDTAPYGPFTYADAFKSIVDVQGVLPDDNSEWYQKVKNFARNNVGGGRYFGVWGTADADRAIPRFADTMNVVSPGSATVHTTSDGHSYTCVHRVYGNPDGTAPQTWSLDGITQNAYEWQIRTGDTTAPAGGNIPPTADAGDDTTMLFITTGITLVGDADDADGSVASVLWTKQSGPSCTITSPTSLTTTVTGMSRGTYVFRLTATDDEDEDGYDERIVYNGIPCNEAAPVTYTISPTAPNEIYITNGYARGWKGGDTLLIPAGTYTVLEIDSFGGDPCRPIYIRNVGGQVIVNGSIRFKKDVHYVEIVGKDSAGITYGFKCTNFASDRVSWFTMAFIEVGPNPSGTGIYLKQDPYNDQPWNHYPNYINRKITIRNCYVHNVDGEGMYIGHTYPNGDPAYSYNIPQRLDSVFIYDNRVDSTGWDGIQLSNARNGCLIFGNTVTNFGLLDLDGQRAGIISGGNTNSKVYNNNVSNGYGNGIQFFGYGLLEGYNNTVTNVGNTASHADGEQSFYSNAYLNGVETNPEQTIYLYNNTVSYPKVRGIYRADNTGSMLDTVTLENNKFCFTVEPAATWKDDYILVPTGWTDTNNILWCPSNPAGIRLRIRVKQQ